MVASTSESALRPGDDAEPVAAVVLALSQLLMTRRPAAGNRQNVLLSLLIVTEIIVSLSPVIYE
jgi:hypothetical protein